MVVNGMTVSGAGITAGTTIIGFISGQGMLGTYLLSASQTTGSATVTSTTKTEYFSVSYTEGDFRY